MPASQVLFLSSTLPDIFILVVKPMNSPVDAGYGKDVKFEVGNQMSRWLDVDEKKSRWSGDGDGKLTASNRRVLMTMWVAEAKEIVHQKVDSLWRYFEKTNALIITADGTRDEFIQPQRCQREHPNMSLLIQFVRLRNAPKQLYVLWAAQRLAE